MPSNPDEALIVLEMIKILKQYSSPSEITNLGLISAPHYFLMEFGNKTIHKSINLQPLVISSIDMNYGSGVVDTTFDGMPKVITMTLNMTERRMITHEDWENIYFEA